MYQNCQPLVLASASPRRKKLLAEVGLQCIVAAADIDERQRTGEQVNGLVLRLAEEKARMVGKAYPDIWIIAGDTAVSLGDHVFGKPASQIEAIDVLMQLSGKTHVVSTGYCLYHQRSATIHRGAVTVRVRLTSFSTEVAAAYVATGEPLDKAGAYGIQGPGGALIESIDGSYSGVVGLPMAEVLAILLEEELITPASGEGSGIRT